MRDLYDDAHALAGVVGHVGARIGSTEYRVAASTLSLGYAARLWSLTLGGIVRAGILPDADRLLWRDTDGRIDLHLAEPVGWGGTGLVDVAREMVLDRHLAPLVAAIRTVEPMSDRLLWGNAASALIGAARMLDGASDTAAMRVAETMLRDSRLIDTVDRQGDGYRRRSCCLFYRTPVSGYCGTARSSLRTRPSRGGVRPSENRSLDRGGVPRTTNCTRVQKCCPSPLGSNGARPAFPPCPDEPSGGGA